MKAKFILGQTIGHRNGGTYRVVELPQKNKLLEDCALPFYGYECLATAVIWHRRHDEMEDGRFTIII